MAFDGFELFLRRGRDILGTHSHAHPGLADRNPRTPFGRTTYVLWVARWAGMCAGCRMGGVDTMDLVIPMMRAPRTTVTAVHVWSGLPPLDPVSFMDDICGVWAAPNEWVLTRDFLRWAPPTPLWEPFRPWVLSAGVVDLPTTDTYAVALHDGHFVPECLFRAVGQLYAADSYGLNGWDLLTMGSSQAFLAGARDGVLLPPYLAWARLVRPLLGGFRFFSQNPDAAPVVTVWCAESGALWARRLHLAHDDPWQFLPWLDTMLPIVPRPDRWPALTGPVTSPAAPLSFRLIDWLATSGRENFLERARVVEGLLHMAMLTLTMDATPTRTIILQGVRLLTALYRLYHDAAYEAQTLLFYPMFSERSES